PHDQLTPSPYFSIIAQVSSASAASPRLADFSLASHFMEQRTRREGDGWALTVSDLEKGGQSMKRRLGQHRGAILLGVPAALVVAAAITVGPAVSAARGHRPAPSAPSSTSPQLLGGVGMGCGSWSTIPSANPSPLYAYLSGVAAVPGTQTAWAVGAALVSF